MAQAIGALLLLENNAATRGIEPTRRRYGLRSTHLAARDLTLIRNRSPSPIWSRSGVCALPDSFGAQQRNDTMNMMATLTADHPYSAESNSRACYLDENGNPSDRSGPDLTKATPIKSVASRIKTLRTRGKRHDAALYLIDALKASSLDLQAGWTASLREVREGTDEKEISLSVWFACDVQETLRRQRYEALKPLIDDLRVEIIDIIMVLGRFSDLRPFATGQDAIDAVLAAGARVYRLPDGKVGLALPIGKPAWENDYANGWRLKRAAQRFHVSLHHHAAEMARIVKQFGARSGSGYLLQSTEASNGR